MKILYSCLSKSWGGLEMKTIEGAIQLIRKNIKVDILCYPGSRINLEAEKNKIRCITLKAHGYFHPVKIFKLSGILKSNSYDLIHTQYSKDLWVLVPALNYIRSEIPLVLTKRMESSVVKKDILHKKLYNRVNKILAISNVIRENVIKTCPVSPEKVILHFNGIDLEKFNPEKSDGKKIRDEFAFKDNEIIVGMLSRISYGKGYEELLNAAAILVKEFSHIKFLLIGNSDPSEREYEEKVKKLAEDLSLTERIIFTGFRKDVADLLSAVDIFVFPSHAESFGNALVEAMAMEKPCIGTDSHGVLDIIEDGVNGFLFNKKDEKNLAYKIKLLINSPGERTVKGRAARQSVKEKFDSGTQTLKLIDLYRNILS